MTSFSLGSIPAAYVDYGGYQSAALESLSDELHLIRKRLDACKRALSAVQVISDRISGHRPLPRNTPQYQREFDDLMSAARYSADPAIDLSWLPKWAFMRLMETSSIKLLKELAMSQKAFSQALTLLWPRNPHPKSVERFQFVLEKTNESWRLAFDAEVPVNTAYGALTHRPRLSPKVAVSQSTTVVKRRRDPESPLPSVPQRPRNFFDIALNSNLNTRSFYTSSEQQDQQISARLVDAFERIKNDALSVRLLSILRILGRCPGRWFERATSPRQRWNDKGELESHLPDFCQLHSLDIPGAMDLLLDNGLIIRDQEGCLALPPALKEYVVDHLPDQGAIRVCALLLTCHLFPGDKNIDSCNRSDGTLLLDPLQRIIPFLPSMLEQRLLVREEEYIVIETILYASRFPSPVTGSAAQFDNLDAADNMLLRWPDHSLRLFAAIRRKALSRLCHGTVWKEPGVLLRLAPANPRINALQWELRLSRAQDHVENDDWDGARTEVSNFAPFQSNKVSTMERCQETEIQTHLSRFLYLAGRFGATLQLLQRMDASVNPKDEIIHTSHLAGAMCELGDPLGAIEITRTKLKGSSSTRLRVLFAECLLHYGMALCDTSSHIPKEAQSSFNESKQICDGIMASFETIPNFFRGQAKQDDRVCYLRTATVVARICTLEAIFGEGNLKDARCSWISALYAVRNCRWRRTGYMEGICHFTLAFIGIWESPVAETLNCDLEMAERYISRAGFRHLIIGMGPLWYNLIHKLALRKGDRRFRLAALTSL